MGIVYLIEIQQFPLCLLSCSCIVQPIQQTRHKYSQTILPIIFQKVNVDPDSAVHNCTCTLSMSNSYCSFNYTYMGVRAINGLFGSDSSKRTNFGPEVDNTIRFTFLRGTKTDSRRGRHLFNMAAIRFGVSPRYKQDLD